MPAPKYKDRTTAPDFIDFTPAKSSGKPFVTQRTLDRAIEKKLRKLVDQHIAFLASEVEMKIEEVFVRKMMVAMKNWKHERRSKPVYPRIKMNPRIKKIFG